MERLELRLELKLSTSELREAEGPNEGRLVSTFATPHDYPLEVCLVDRTSG